MITNAFASRFDGFYEQPKILKFIEISLGACKSACVHFFVVARFERVRWANRSQLRICLCLYRINTQILVRWICVRKWSIVVVYIK